MDTLGVDMSDWQEAQEAFWDDAVKGSSALRAALYRRMLDEMEATEGRSSLNGYCDLEKFYDSISLVKLIHHAQAAGFPSVALSLVLQIHLATRILRVNNWVSNPILPCTGIVAGCRSSGHLARVILYPVLQKMHEAYMPKPLHFRCFLDDLVLKLCEESDATTIAYFVDSFHEIISDLKHRRLKHSEAKTVIRSKDNALASKAVRRLATLGLLLNATSPSRI
jgi:hypothetical protein